MGTTRVSPVHSVSARELDRLTTFVLAGGQGRRLYPLTKDRTKPSVVFGGIYRIIDFTLSNCINSGIRRVHVLTQYKSISLARHIKLGWNILSSELTEFIDVIPAQQQYEEVWYRGTADAICQNMYTIEKERPKVILILAGDHIYKMDYSKMLLFHLENKSEVTIGVVEMPRELSSQFGVLQVDGDGIVREFKEKPVLGASVPGQPDRIYASMGIYIFDKRVLCEEVIPGVETNNLHDFGEGIIPHLIGRRRILAYQFEDENHRDPPYWRDIGTLDAYFEANMDLVSVDPRFNLYDDSWPVRTHQRQFPPAKTVFGGHGDAARKGEAIDSLISSGCIISGGRVVRSILSPRVRVNSYSQVDDSVLLDGVEVGRHSKIRRAIIDKYVKIEPNTMIGYDLDADRQRFLVTDSGVVVISGRRTVGPETNEPLMVDPMAEYRSLHRED